MVINYDILRNFNSGIDKGIWFSIDVGWKIRNLKMKQRLRPQRTNLIFKGSISIKIHADERSWNLQKLKVATLATQVEREGLKPYLL